MSVHLLTAPAVEPVTLAEAKAWARIDTSDDDALVSALITAARQRVEAHTRRALIDQTWRQVLDAWPEETFIRFPLAPFRSLTAMRVYDSSGTPQTVSPALYTLVNVPDCARVYFAAPAPTPGRPIGGIEIDMVVGYGASAANVPEPPRKAILRLVAQLYENRGDEASTGPGTMPAHVLAMLYPYRRMRLL